MTTIFLALNSMYLFTIRDKTVVIENPFIGIPLDRGKYFEITFSPPSKYTS